MSQIDISIATILKIFVSWAFMYLIAPLLLAARDMLMLKIIEWWVLTDSLSFDIGICEADRWYMNNKYQKQRKIKLPVSGGKRCFELDSEEVSEEDYNNYDSGLKMHQNRFQVLDAKINSRHNLIFWLTKHYKQDGFKSPIPSWREESYQRAERENA